MKGTLKKDQSRELEYFFALAWGRVDDAIDHEIAPLTGPIKTSSSPPPTPHSHH